ncbi:MAG: glycerol-3-phosphate 1-O-acyltransferase PlsY [Bacillus sp. (in: firmicutes)]
MTLLSIIVIAYLLGSIPSGLWIGKIFFGKDIREFGSGNLGGTNTFRTLGKTAGLIVTLMDVLKGTAATLLPLLFGYDAGPIQLLAGGFAVVGHMYPIFAGFRGGKAVATSGGIILGYAPLLFLMIFVTFFIVLYLSKYVSLSSMATALVALIITLFMGDYWLVALVAILVFFIFYRHRANIARIRNGTEPKVKWI